VVPPKLRSLGIGKLAGQSFLHFAPRLGYRGSVFNLVYATNEASAKIWDRLGFDRVGRIPQAGLMRKAGTTEEQYVDAWVMHGDFSKIAPEAMAAAGVDDQ
jgi:L-amino acid N-acyltransferase YncA